MLTAKPSADLDAIDNATEAIEALRRLTTLRAKERETIESCYRALQRAATRLEERGIA